MKDMFVCVVAFSYINLLALNTICDVHNYYK